MATAACQDGPASDEGGESDFDPYDDLNARFQLHMQHHGADDPYDDLDARYETHMLASS